MKHPGTYAAVWALTCFAPILFALPAMADQVINDDLIVIGNACIGFDCVNNFPFADDELVLRENNLRISFGADGQFRLAANETVNGGANEFRIDTIRELIVVTDEGAVVPFESIASFPGAIEPGDGTLLVPLELIPGATLANPRTDGTTTFAPGQTAILPAGSWTSIGGSLYNIAANTPITSTAPSGGFDAQIANGAESLVAFGEAGNIVTLGINSQDVAGAVSVGSPTTQRQVQGVADAVAVDDVINVGQLSRALSMPMDLSDRIQSETSRLEGVSAMTAAMSALQPNPRAQAPLSISLGLGAYEGETAAALGLLFRVSDASHFQFSVAGSDETSPQSSVSFRIVW